MNLVLLFAPAAFDFNTSDEQTLTQNRQQEGSGKANTRDSGANREGTLSAPYNFPRRIVHRANYDTFWPMVPDRLVMEGQH